MNSLENNKIVVIFGGRFQPFHAGHQQVYDHLCDKFGEENIWVTSSNKCSSRSPLNFKQKKKIACEYFDIPPSRFIRAEIPYKPTELFKRFQNNDFSLVLALGEKDSDRFEDSDYFKKFPCRNKKLEFFEDRAYIYSVPIFASGCNATQLRKKFQGKLTESKKKHLFKELFGGFDLELFKALTKSNS